MLEFAKDCQKRSLSIAKSTILQQPKLRPKLFGRSSDFCRSFGFGRSRKNVASVVHYIDLNARSSSFGLTAFMYACSRGHKEIVKILLSKRNIDFNLRDKDGWTAFVFACNNGLTDVVQLLLDHKEANIEFNVKDHY